MGCREEKREKKIEYRQVVTAPDIDRVWAN